MKTFTNFILWDRRLVKSDLITKVATRDCGSEEIWHFSPVRRHATISIHATTKQMADLRWNHNPGKSLFPSAH
jgi:hypothetical protein